MSHKIAVPLHIRQLMALMEQAGYECCAVGGCVRDSLLGVTPQDWDLCTSARPEQTIACFAAAGCRTIPTGIRHGTVTVLWDGEPVEVTTYRIDGSYSDSRHPDAVTFTTALEVDLSRRDFTINAMACRADGVVIDLFQGQQDLSLGRIRCVGNPRRRFEEDALRILRALRFASRLDFTLDTDTGLAAIALRDRLREIAPERIWHELTGLLAGKAAGRSLAEYFPVLQVVFPDELTLQGWRKGAGLLQNLSSTVARLAMLLWQGTGLTESSALEELGLRFCRMLRIQRQIKQQLSRLLWQLGQPVPQSMPQLRRLAGVLGTELSLNLAQLWCAVGQKEAGKRLESIVDQGECVCIRQLAVTGKELQQLGFSKGPSLGKMLEWLLELVMEGKLENTKEALLAFAAAQQKKGC